jgi:hypothetical protein
MYSFPANTLVASEMIARHFAEVSSPNKHGPQMIQIQRPQPNLSEESLGFEMDQFQADAQELDWDALKAEAQHGTISSQPTLSESLSSQRPTQPRDLVDKPLPPVPPVPLELLQEPQEQLTPALTATSLPSPSSEPCPPLDNTSLSLSSSLSSSISASGRSVSGDSSRLSEGGVTGSSGSLNVRKRGYMRPQATLFADSAKNRDSVMSLGSIAHLQYYFARTGLLDGKGAQLARKDAKTSPLNVDTAMRSASVGVTSSSALLSPTDVPSYAASENGASAMSPTQSFLGEGLTEPWEQDGSIMADAEDWDRELAMLPPTVSTYKFQRPAYLPPPPDLTMLRRELTDTLEDALKVLKEADDVKPNMTEIEGKGEETDGWFAIQGLHLLDITTLAIRAAKNYYISHSSYQKLHSIKPETEIRRDLHSVLEILQRMAGRNFAGGLRQNEKVGILNWIVGISELIATEIEAEKKEVEDREKYSWRIDSNWESQERRREEAFLRCFAEPEHELPAWEDPETEGISLPTAFQRRLATGVDLIKLHNSCVRASKRHFELIKTWHTDTTKLYRRAENLRYWAKAAELRWDKVVPRPLDFDAFNVALLADDAVPTVEEEREKWIKFDRAMLAWCKGVREELVEEWERDKEKSTRRNVTPRIEIDEAGLGETSEHSVETLSIVLPDVDEQAAGYDLDLDQERVKQGVEERIEAEA